MENLWFLGDYAPPLDRWGLSFSNFKESKCMMFYTLNWMLSCRYRKFNFTAFNSVCVISLWLHKPLKIKLFLPHSINHNTNRRIVAIMLNFIWIEIWCSFFQKWQIFRRCSVESENSSLGEGFFLVWNVLKVWPFIHKCWNWDLKLMYLISICILHYVSVWANLSSNTLLFPLYWPWLHLVYRILIYISHT